MLRLALADLWHERVLFLCSLLGCAAVLAPLVVLFGLRHGVIAALRSDLIEDPHAREITSMVNREFDAGFFRNLAARPDVAFVVPRTRALSATMLIEAGGRTARVELVPTAPADPLLGDLAPAQIGEIVLSPNAAERLGIAPGARVTGVVSRTAGGRREDLELPLTVTAIAPASAFLRDGAFALLPLLQTAEDFLDGTAPADARLESYTPNPARAFAGFRLYARSLEDVVALDRDFRLAGIEVASRADQVESLLLLDRNLGLVFAAVAGIGGAGYLVSLGVGLWANVERKRHDIALLSLLGLRRGALLAFPVLQAGLIGLAGAGLALTLAFAVAGGLNRAFAGSVIGDRPVCLIEPPIAAAAAGITLAGAVIAALLSGLRAAAIEPAEGLREA